MTTFEELDDMSRFDIIETIHSNAWVFRKSGTLCEKDDETNVYKLNLGEYTYHFTDITEELYSDDDTDTVAALCFTEILTVGLTKDNGSNEESVSYIYVLPVDDDGDIVEHDEIDVCYQSAPRYIDILMESLKVLSEYAESMIPNKPVQEMEYKYKNVLKFIEHIDKETRNKIAFMGEYSLYTCECCGEESDVYTLGITYNNHEVTITLSEGILDVTRCMVCDHADNCSGCTENGDEVVGKFFKRGITVLDTVTNEEQYMIYGVEKLNVNNTETYLFNEISGNLNMLEELPSMLQNKSRIASRNIEHMI